jgi:hypothetical protein
MPSDLWSECFAPRKIVAADVLTDGKAVLENILSNKPEVNRKKDLIPSPKERKKFV